VLYGLTEFGRQYGEIIQQAEEAATFKN